MCVGEKIDLAKLSDISRAKKKDIIELSVKLVNLQSDKDDKTGTKEKLDSEEV